jgi:hypothetical protein
VLPVERAGPGEQAPEVHHPLAELHVVLRAEPLGVLDVEEPVAISVALHEGERVAPADHGVPRVELQSHACRIEPLDEHVVGHLAVDCPEVPRLVVEAEPESGAPHRLAGGVQAVPPAPVVVQGGP